ncbi:AmmeMemoRadiSam system radical SAM enzyme [Candidatus Woesearchaeota archaeon B3_Woes]|nr:MAG: AmmeMemoRadiSam system radical SAM enzyme [Candidatus Woesearchaeota archaeon B3_Woes]
MPIEALYYEKLRDKIVQCHLCPKKCIIKPDKFGNCNARQNIKGRLYSLVYGNLCSISIDPIEKKPLFHFMPGQQVFSIGTTGCNLHCQFCQNWTTSQIKPDTKAKKFTPKQVVKEAIDSGCGIIAYTYNEPIIFYEFVLETAKLAKKKGIKNVIVCNGFINEEPLKELLPYLDAANIDLKSFEDRFYKEICDAWIQPVLNTLKMIHQSDTLLEITNLIIPKLNDNMEKIDEMCKWISSNLGNDVPLHFSAFYPCYQMEHLPPTSAEILLEAKKIAERNKLNYVYIGNLQLENQGNTYCPKCNQLLIERAQFNISQNNISNGKCKFCKQEINGVWD